jgi:hypothetical protein
MDKMKCGDGSLGRTTSGRSDDHTSAVSNSAVSTSAAFGQLFSEAGVGQSGSVHQWTSTEQDFSASFELGELLGTGGEDFPLLSLECRPMGDRTGQGVPISFSEGRLRVRDGRCPQSS